MLDTEKIEHSIDYISGYDHSLRIVVWNSAVAKKYGIRKEDAIGKHVYELFPHIEGDFRIRCLQGAIEENQAYFFPSLPYAFEAGIYTNLVYPLAWGSELIALNIVRDHVADECFSRADLLGLLLASPATV